MTKTAHGVVLYGLVPKIVHVRHLKMNVSFRAVITVANDSKLLLF